MPSDPREAGITAVEVFCESRVPKQYRDQVRLECSRRGNSITIVERRPPWNPTDGDWSSMKVAQVRYHPATKSWTLYRRDRNERWWPYPGVATSATLDPLLAEIDADPTGIFWG